MAESLKSRVGRVIAGGMHALIDHIEDQAPEAMMEQSIREADAVIDEVRHELGMVAANRHLAQQQHANLNGQHEKLIEQVNHALDASRDDLARAAVARQLDIEAQIPVLETTLAEYARQETELHGYVNALLAKKREMIDALADFRKSRALAASALAASTGAGKGPSSSEQKMQTVANNFDRLYSRQTGLTATAQGTTMQQAAKLRELDELMRENKIAERMAALKAKKL